MADSRAMTESSESAPPSPWQSGAAGEAAGASGGEQRGLGRFIPEGVQASLERWLGANPLRKLALGLGLLTVLALGVGLFLWAGDSSKQYKTLYTDLSSENAAEVLNALEQQGLSVQLDQATGDIRVPEGKVHRARIYLASQGLPKGSGFGYEILKEDPGFGVSEAMQQARFDRALETELARSIETLRGVESARVHLDNPEESVFVRDRKESRASVVLTLDRERELPQGQIEAIIHLVASAVSGLEHKAVSVVDHRGRLLTDEEERQKASAVEQDRERTRRFEQRLQRQVEDLVAPIVGADRARAQVSAELNFDQRRRLEESFDPQRSAIRSEQMSERSGGGSSWPMGIPGALTNQPPGPGQLNPDGEGGDGGASTPFSSSETRNWEVGRTLREVQPARGTVDRLTVGVLLGHRYVKNDSGEVVQEPIGEEQLASLRELIKGAVGYDEARGDQLSVVTVPFAEITEPPAPPEAIWEQDWVRDLIRLGVFAAIGLLVYFIALRPLVNRMIGGGSEQGEDSERAAWEAQGLERPAGEALQSPEGGGEGSSAGRQAAQLEGFSGEQLSDVRERPYEAKLQAVLELVENEPELAANAVKEWLDEDDKRKG